MKPALCRLRAYSAPGLPRPASRRGDSALEGIGPHGPRRYFFSGALAGAPPAAGAAPAAPGAAAAPAAGAAPGAPGAPGTAPSSATSPSSTGGNSAAAAAAAAAAFCSSMTLVGATIEQIVKSRPRMIDLTPSGRLIDEM